MSREVILSIIIPVFNVEKYLNRCIKSVLFPLNDDIEIILIDDGSTDKSPEICDDYEKNYSKYIKTYHKQNGGLSSARNEGIEHASGRYLFFLDSDDWVVSEMLVNVLPILKKNRCDIFSFDCFFEKNSGKINYKITDGYTVLSKYEAIDDILKFKSGNQSTFRIYKRQLFLKIRFPLGKNYEDIFTTHKLILSAETIIRNESQYYIYNLINASSITKTTTIENMENYIHAINEFCSDIEANCSTQNIFTKEDVDNFKYHHYIYAYLKALKIKDANGLRSYIEKYLNGFSAWKMLNNPCLDKKRSIVYALMHALKHI